MSDRILVFPAGASYVGNLAAARRSGFEVVTVDQDDTAPGFDVVDYSEPVDITDEDGVLGVAKEYDVVGVVPLNDYAVPAAARVADELGLVGLDPDVAATCTDKAAMRRRWEQASLPQPAFRVVETLEGAASAAETIGYPVVCKPAVSTGGGSRGVSVVEGADDLPDAVTFAQSPYDDKRVLVEDCAVGSEHSVEVVVEEGDATAIVVSDKVKTPEPYRVDKSVLYPAGLDESVRTVVERTCEDAATALGIETGAAHVELAVTDDGPRLFELGARCGGGATADPIVNAVTGIDYIPKLCRLYAGVDSGDWRPSRRHGVTYRFLTPSPGTIAEVRGVDEVLSWEGVLDCRLYVEPGDTVEPVRVGGDRSGAVITTAPTRDTAIRLADEAERTIEFQYE